MKTATESVLKSPRIYGLDVARCMAVSMIFTIHSVQIIFQNIKLPYIWYLGNGGVELFFSLSGFLIGKILLKFILGPINGIHSMTQFWVRRWLRTLPLYFILYFTYLLFYNIFIYKVPFDIRYLFFVQNLKSEIDFFKISWSLSIEEWSYFLLPIFILIANILITSALHKTNGTAAFLSTAFIFIIAMITCRQLSVDGKPQTRFIIYRMDATSYGLIAAWVSTKIKQAGNKKALVIILSGLTIWLIAALILELKISPYLQTVYYPVCGAGTSIFVLGLYYYSFKRNFWFVTYISKISYSIYLTHLYLLLLPLAFWTSNANYFILILVWILSFGMIVIIASLTFKYIEQPFLQLREKYFPYLEN